MGKFRIVCKSAAYALADGTMDSFRMVSIYSGRRGPIGCITAVIHGDEPAGHDVAKWFVASPQLLFKGTLHIFPLVNRWGYEIGQRKVAMGPHSTWQDLNRHFDGNPKGSNAERLAAALRKRIVACRPDFVIDIHSQATKPGERSLICIVLDRAMTSKGEKTLKRVRSYAASTGVTVCKDEVLPLYVSHGRDQSLSGVLVNKYGIPACTLELDHADNPKTVENGVRAVQRTLAYFEMCAEPQMHWRCKPDFKVPASSLRICEVGANFSTLENWKRYCKYLVHIGDCVYKSQVIAVDPLGEKVVAPEAGWVLALGQTMLARGDDVAVLAVEESP